MKRILAAGLVLPLAGLAGHAGASDRCDLTPNGAAVLVRYPIPHGEPVPYKHTNKHVIWSVDRELASRQDALGDDEDPRIVAVGDFNGDAGCDFVWEEREPEGPAIIKLAVLDRFEQVGSDAFSGGRDRLPLPWMVASADDFTGDGRTDLLWWNPETATARLWVRLEANPGWQEADVNGGVPPPMGPVPPEWWQPVASAQLEANAPAGIIWYYPYANQPLRYYRAQWTGQQLDLQFAGYVEGLDPQGWRIVAVGDFDHDGRDDLLREQKSNPTRVEVCFMDGLRLRERRDMAPSGFAQIGFGGVWDVVGPR
jgi:hypothetical protein